MLLFCACGIGILQSGDNEFSLWAIATHHKGSTLLPMVTVISSNTCQKNVAAYELEHKSNWCQFDETNKYSPMYNMAIFKRRNVNTMKLPSQVINLPLATLYTQVYFLK